MTITRRQLYAAGECFGECATRREAGRIVCGGGDSESTQNQQDKRNAVQGGVGVSGDSNTVTMNVTDGGIASRALDSIDRSNALTAGSFDKLLQSSEKLWDRGERLIGQTQQSALDAYRTANTDAKGTIDNKTIIVLAVAGAAAAGAIAFARK